MSRDTLLLNYDQVDSLMAVEHYIDAVEEAYAYSARKRVLDPKYFDVPSEDGEFHVKGGGIIYGDDIYFAVKESGCFFNNLRHYGLPTIYGLIILCNGKNAAPLAVFDSGPVTAKRTAAATAVAAKYLARKDSKIVTICGAGTQGKHQLHALKCVLNVKQAYIYDINDTFSTKYAHDMTKQAKVTVEPVAYDDLERCIQQSDVLVTCTPSTTPYITNSFLPTGILVSAIGSDNAHKQELESDIIPNHKVIVDSVYQCSQIGETHHSIKDNLFSQKDIHAEIGDVITNKAKGRESEDEVIIFDSTGIALQDVASAVRIYNTARSQNIGTYFKFS